jgi:hypothetical protein
MFNGFQSYQPSKTALFWSCAACAVGAIVLGFTWGGWSTATTVEELTQKAADEARVELATTICVEQFKAGADAAGLQAVKDEPVYARDDVIDEGGWATMPGYEKAEPGVPAACAQRVAELETVGSSATAAAG